MLPQGLKGLEQFNQFIVYKLVPSSRAGKTDKFPIDYRTLQMPEKGSGASSIWTSYETAFNAATSAGKNYGVGFSFTKETGFFFLDVDNCLQADNTWSPIALQMCQVFAGAAIEISQSGRGLHIFGRGNIPEHACKNTTYGLELYHEDRFVALTGQGVVGDVMTDCSKALPWVVSTYFSQRKEVEGAPTSWTTEPAEGWNGPTDDAELIRRMMASKPSAASVFDNKATIAQLWNADEEALSKAFPSSTGGVYDASSADITLAMHLAFWTGRDCERIKRLMFQSALVREKWSREEYVTETILNACARTSNVLSDKPIEPVATADKVTGPKVVSGETYISPEKQFEVFKDCIYISDIHKVLVPGGKLLGPDQFRVAYGGFEFVMNPYNSKTEKDAWKCFTQSQAVRFPRADTTCFRPDLPANTMVDLEGLKAVNLYVEIETARVKGDVSLFLNHLKKLLPVQRDREILLSYMAACVQYKGVKFQWAPVIQGVEGNGKTLFSRVVAQAVGMRYSHFPNAAEMGEKYNTWLYRNLFIGVEDIYIPEDKLNLIEILKPMITGDRLAIRGMGAEQVMRDICANFILNTNHMDGVKKTRNDRRYASMFCAQQNEADLERDGLNDEYFNRLYTWLKKENGFAAVTDFLMTYQIPAEFGLGCLLSRAPYTSSTEVAITASMGRVEQEILERVESGFIGFKGGWISSHFVDMLVAELRMEARYPRILRRSLMQSLGYDWHPNLPNGRVHNPVSPDNCKAVLYLKRGHIASGLTSAAEIAHAYTKAQETTNAETGVNVSVITAEKAFK